MAEMCVASQRIYREDTAHGYYRAGFDRGVGLEHDVNRLRLGRKIIHSVIQPRGIEEYRGRIQHYLAVYLKRTLDAPSGFMQHASRQGTCIL